MSPGQSNFLTGQLKQTAVYWGDPESDGTGGRSFGSAYPIEIDVRWEQRRELFIDQAGQETTSRAIVFVGQDVDLGGYLYLGTLDDLSSAEEADPLVVDGAYEIRSFSKTPSVKANQFLRKAWV